MGISNRDLKTAEWVANAYSVGKITMNILKGNPLALISHAGVTVTVGTVIKMLDNRYCHCSSFNSNIFTSKVIQDYESWKSMCEDRNAFILGYSDQLLKAQNHTTNEKRTWNNETDKRSSAEKRLAKREAATDEKRRYLAYDWSSFEKVENRMIEHFHVAKYVNITSRVDRMRLFFRYKTEEMALLRLALSGLSEREINDIKLMFIGIGVISG